MVQWVGANQSSVLMCSAALLLGCVGLMLQGEWLRALNIAGLAGLCFSQSTSVNYNVANEEDRMPGWETWWIANPSKTESMGILIGPLSIMQIVNVPRTSHVGISLCSWLLCGLRVCDRFSCGTVGPLSGGAEIFVAGAGITLSLVETLVLQSTAPLWAGVICLGLTIYSQGSGTVIDTTNLRVLAPLIASIISCGIDSETLDVQFLTRWSILSATLFCPVLRSSLGYMWDSNKNELFAKLLGEEEKKEEPVRPATLPVPSMDSKLPSMEEILKLHKKVDNDYQKKATDPLDGIPVRLRENLLSTFVLILIFVIWFPWILSITSSPFSQISVEQFIVYIGVAGTSLFSPKVASAICSILILADSSSQGIWVLICLILLLEFFTGIVKVKETHTLFPLIGALQVLWFNPEASIVVVGMLLSLGLLQMMIRTTEKIELTSDIIPKAIRVFVGVASLAWLYSSDFLPLLSISITGLLCQLSLHPQWLTLPHLLFFTAVHFLFDALV